MQTRTSLTRLLLKVSQTRLCPSNPLLVSSLSPLLLLLVLSTRRWWVRQSAMRHVVLVAYKLSMVPANKVELRITTMS